MSPKYRLLLAVVLTLAALCGQAVFAQTKTLERSFTVDSQANCFCTLAITPTVTKTSACDKNDGAVAIGVAGAKGQLTYKWTDAAGTVVATTKDLAKVLAGSYFLEVTDAGAPYCGTFTYGVTVASPLTISTTVTDLATCANRTGAIVATVTGGSGSYSFSWKYPDNTEVAVKDLAGLVAGNYYLKVTDTRLGCTTAKLVAVKSRSQLVVAQVATTANTSCAAPNGAADIRVTGGSGQYQFNWYDLSTFGIVATTEDATRVKGGQYGAYVTDRVSGCMGYLAVTVPDQTIKPAVAFNGVRANTKCSSPFDGAVDLQVSGSPGPFDVTWTLGDQNVSTLEDPTNLGSGVYNLKVADKTTLCETTVPATDAKALRIDDSSLPALDATPQSLVPNTDCLQPNGAISIAVTNPKTPYTVAWTGPNNFVASGTALSGLTAGTYQVKVTAECNVAPVIAATELSRQGTVLQVDLLSIITDANRNLDPATISIVQAPLSNAVATLGDDHVLAIDYTGMRYAGTDRMRIRACDLLDACTESELSWPVTADVMGARAGDIVVHNAVAPNSGGDNRFMRIRNLPEGSFVGIYNRWGDQVFGTQHYNDAQPGQRFEGVSQDGRQLPTGTYFYKITFADGRTALTGYVALQQ